MIEWLKNRSLPMTIVNSDRVKAFTRHCFLMPDEYWSGHRLVHKLPWWLPFNMFIHEWEPGATDTSMHSHPRWSITIVLKGEIREITPKYDRWLTPGNIVLRTHKAIHKFYMREDCKCTTLFIVGRRKYTQYEYDMLGNKTEVVGHTDER